MAFEEFTGGRVVTKEPRVSMLKQGNFNFNKGVMKIMREKNITHLALMYDKETNRIAFKPCGKEAPNAYEIRSIKGTGQLSGSAFLKFYQIPFGNPTRSLPAVWQDEMLIISLN
jgi:hypothetical protein